MAEVLGEVGRRGIYLHRRAKNNFVSQATLDTIDQSCRARLNGGAELFRELRRKTVRALRVDKEACMRESVRGSASPVIR